MIDELDRLAEQWLTAHHSRDWYIGNATRAEWEQAYKEAALILNARASVGGRISREEPNPGTSGPPQAI